ncbi:excinuclease, subunit C [Streptococcus pneumoniae]|nr:excinuclease%2C subunit C [Streptococcus pseudopneumoniae]COC84663.1 excinuclease%2C subunit C [Streptococcus pseudopneumoniae]VIQ04507.1 excinuclease, subunit C [Streptococcus pneumoniae]VJJ42462.1 excinuclease, subunit C [Streptococcus pneumoniae]
MLKDFENYMRPMSRGLFSLLFCYNGIMNNLIKSKLELLPTSPGCYIHKDKNGTIIYVGKAKNLRNRVRSYFRGSHDTKTEALVSEIVDFEFIVTESNIEALLLEINLIKENKPKYNIMLKDDKSYPFIKITNERYPRLIITRQVKKDGGLYFGPYPDVGAANEIKRLLDRIFPFRKCTNPPSKVCFYYHIGQCMSHTICKKDEDYFKSMAQEVSDFLKGQDDKIIDNLKGKMAAAAQTMEFERAAEYRDLIQAIGTLRTKQRVMAKDLQNRDVFGYYVDKGWMCVQVFFVRQGKLIERDVNLFPYFNDPDEDFLTYVGQFYQEKSHLVPNEVLIPQDIDQEAVKALVDSKILKPQRGEKKQLVNLAIKNARVSLEQKFNLLEKSVEKTQGAIENLGRLLQIPTPVRIESFDNSNIMGTSPVSAMVVFVNGKPSKKDYRKYKIKTVVGPDDYASMREVIRRRYGRVQREGLTPPDLIVIDGGQGQVNIAKQVIQEELGLDIPIAGLQKNDKHQTHELLFGDPLEVVDLSRNSQEFFLLQRIQDEVHRFAITFHRQLRSKNSFSSQLDGIDGLGSKRKQNLMRHFKSLTKIKEASVDEIVEVGVPRAVAEAVQRKLNPQEAEVLPQVAEESVEYQTEGDHHEP